MIFLILNQQLTQQFYTLIYCYVDRETLGGENPWYCPQCKEECLAKRTLTVQALPKVLMVHLKRFFYQDNFSTKVDTKVHLPLVLEGKCFGDDSTKLTLSSCVCHRGSELSGLSRNVIHCILSLAASHFRQTS